jgi:hypothetical protein
LIWRTSTRSYLACLFCARAPLVQSFCLFVLHFAFGVGAFNTTTYCSVSRMSWTCTYLGSVWCKHTHTNDVSCGDYMVAYEDFAHVGVACLVFSCGTIVHWFRVLPRTPKAGCVFRPWAGWCEKMCCWFWARFYPSCLSTTSLMSADVSRGKTWWVLAPHGMTYPNHHFTLWPSSHRATNNHFTTNICLFWFPCFVDPIPIELLAHLLFIRLLFESLSTRQRGCSYHQNPVEKSSMLHHVLPKYHW